jgi:hypothetical protein
MRALLAVALISSACIPTTGGQLVSFSLQASGPADVNAGQPYRFQTPAGYAVTLSEARLFVGAVYFNQSNPAGYSQETACVLPGIYTGQVLAPLEVNALDSSAQAFGIQGTGSDTPTLGAELWLHHRQDGRHRRERRKAMALRGALQHRAESAAASTKPRVAGLESAVQAENCFADSSRLDAV